MSRMIRRLHLSPTTSRVRLIGQPTFDHRACAISTLSLRILASYSLICNWLHMRSAIVGAGHDRSLAAAAAHRRSIRARYRPGSRRRLPRQAIAEGQRSRDPVQDHPRPRGAAQRRTDQARALVAGQAGSKKAREARGRPGARQDDEARVLGGLCVERDRGEVARLRGGVPRLRSAKAHLPARRFLGRADGRSAHRAQRREDHVGTRQCRFRAGGREGAWQLRQIPRRMAFLRRGRAARPSWRSAATGSAAIPGR